MVHSPRAQSLSERNRTGSGCSNKERGNIWEKYMSFKVQMDGYCGLNHLDAWNYINLYTLSMTRWNFQHFRWVSPLLNHWLYRFWWFIPLKASKQTMQTSEHQSLDGWRWGLIPVWDASKIFLRGWLHDWGKHTNIPNREMLGHVERTPFLDYLLKEWDKDSPNIAKIQRTGYCFSFGNNMQTRANLFSRLIWLRHV